MQKRFFILILCISLVLGSSVPVFAVSTDSAIKFKSASSVSDVKATGSDYSQDIYNYIVGTNGFPAISSGITALRTLITSHFYRNSGFTLYNWGSQAGISTYTSGNGYFSNYFGSAFTNLSSLLASNTEQIWDTKQYLVQTKSLVNDIYEYISSSGAIDLQPVIDTLNHSDFIGESYSGSLSQTIWQSNDNGTWTTFNQNVSQARRFQNLLIFLTALQRNQALTNASLRRGAGNDVVTNYDLTTSSTTSQSVQQTLQTYGTNISSLLARLAFVLASDEEIAARQAAADNTDAVVDDFISSSGSASASTSDFADVASAGSAMKDALSSDVSPTNAFTSLSSSSNAWDWFSQSTADSLDSTSSSNSRRGSTTPYLDSYYNDLMETLTLR